MIGHGCMIGPPAAAGKGIQIIGRIPIIGERRIVDVTDGLIHRWRLTENANDAIGSSNFINNGSVSFSVENGASFNGSTQYLYNGSFPWSSLFTISLWVRYSTAHQASPFGACPNQNEFVVVCVTNPVVLKQNISNTITTEMDLSDNEWHNIMFAGYSAKGNQWSLYIDSIFQGSAIFGRTLSENVGIGRLASFNGWYYTGYEKDVRMYNRHLTNDERFQILSNGPNP